MWWDIGQLVSKCPIRICLLFSHIWSGCDTTSAIYRQGKLKELNLMRTSKMCQTLAQNFYHDDNTPEKIGESGIEIMIKMFNGKQNDNLASLRHARWEKALISANNVVDPATLPPSKRATHFHSLRVYFELQRAIMLTIDTALVPINWGWKRVHGVPQPKMTDVPVAPKDLLEIIRCDCKMSSRNTCGTMLCKCKKNGLPCSQDCGNCRGAFCNNEMPVEMDESDFKDDGNIFDNIFS